SDRARRMSDRLLLGPPIDAVLDRLYAEHAAQTESMAAYFTQRAAEGSIDWKTFDDRTRGFLSDKLVALDRPKAEFCYHVCRALGARRIVEAGTSFGVSTLYLAAAVRDNVRAGRPSSSTLPPVVIGTEHEPAKASQARGVFADAGVADLIDLRE